MRVLIAATALLISACEQKPSLRPGVDFTIVEVARGLEVPWALAFTPDGRIFVTERPGRVRVIEGGVLRATPVHTFDDVSSGAEQGLMGLALHPQFATNRFLYVSYTHGRGERMRLRVQRFRESGNSLADPVTIIDDIPAAKYHAGSRIAFGPDGKLYVTTGDAFDRPLAQRLDSLAGKILRLNDDGSVPPDNPFRDSPVYSLGHRNAQGLAWHPRTRQLWSTEHGPSGVDGPFGGDELNLITAGGNYGWPVIHHTQKKSGYTPPAAEFTPSLAPASAAFYNGPLQQLRGNLLFGALRGERIERVIFDPARPRRVLRTEPFVRAYGRIREVAMGPDGALYFSTSNRDGRGTSASGDDRILKIVPVSR